MSTSSESHKKVTRCFINVFFNLSREKMAKYRLVNTLNVGDVLLQTLVWLVLVVVTFGLALPFFAYYFIRLIINKTEIHEIP